MRSTALIVTVFVSVVAPRAHASDVRAEQVCSSAHIRAQVLKRDAKNDLVARRAQLQICASPTCARSIVDACTTWMGEVNDLMPSIDLVVTDDVGSSVQGVDLVIDGTAHRDTSVFRAGGAPIELAPGEHSLSVRAAGYRPEQRTINVGPGEKARAVRIVLPTLERVPPAVKPVAESPASPVPTAAWVAFGGGGVGLAVGVVFTVLALDEKAKCSETVCDEGVIPSANDSAVKRDTVGLVIGYAAALVGGGIGVAIWAGHRDGRGANVATSPAGLSVTPLLGFGRIGVGGRF